MTTLEERTTADAYNLMDQVVVVHTWESDASDKSGSVDRRDVPFSVAAIC